MLMLAKKKLLIKWTAIFLKTLLLSITKLKQLKKCRKRRKRALKIATMQLVTSRAST